MKEKIWYIRLAEDAEGPYSVEDLVMDTRVGPETLVWHEGMDEWKRVRDVPELSAFIQEEEQAAPKAPYKSPELSDDLVLLIDQNPPNPTLWFLICVVIILYVFARMILS